MIIDLYIYIYIYIYKLYEKLFIHELKVPKFNIFLHLLLQLSLLRFLVYIYYCTFITFTY